MTWESNLSAHTLLCPRCGSPVTRAPGTETTPCARCGADLRISAGRNGQLRAVLDEDDVNTAILAKRSAIDFIRETNLPPLLDKQQALEHQIGGARAERRRLIQERVVVEPARRPSVVDGLPYMAWALALVMLVAVLGIRIVNRTHPIAQTLLLVAAALAAIALALPIVRRLVWEVQKRHIKSREAAAHASAVGAIQAEERRLGEELALVKEQIAAEGDRILELESELNDLIQP